MRIPPQDIPIVNNHPIDFERRLYPKSHQRAGSFLAKIHGKLVLTLGKLYSFFFIFFSYFKYNSMDSSRNGRCYGCTLF